MPKEFTSEPNAQESAVIAGRNAVTEALKKGRPIDCIYILKGADRGSVGKIIALAKERGVPVKDAAAQKLDALCGGVVHQGVAAMAACHDFSTMEDIFAKAGDQPPFVIICDNIEDPHNLGAIIRTAEAAGAHGVIIPKRRSAGLTSIVGKTSAGAVSYLPVARVPNIPALLKELQQQGVWIFGTAAEGTTSLYEADLKGPAAIVIGSEGEGMGRLVGESCDFTVSIPMFGKINSLNASAAAAVLLYEAVRQRTGN